MGECNSKTEALQKKVNLALETFPKLKELVGFLHEFHCDKMPRSGELACLLTGGRRLSYSDLEILAESHGITINYSPDMKENSGMMNFTKEPSSYPEVEGTGIFLSSETHPKTQSFILGHEIGHAVLFALYSAKGFYPDFPEGYSDRLSDHFLLPDACLNEINAVDVEGIINASNNLVVPIEIIVRRLHRNVQDYGFAVLGISRDGLGQTGLRVTSQAMPSGYSLILGRRAERQGLLKSSEVYKSSEAGEIVDEEEYVYMLRKADKWREFDVNAKCRYLVYEENQRTVLVGIKPALNGFKN